jgi:hypothetical protein
MKPDQGYVIGLRLSPEKSDPEFLTLWFEGENGKNRVACVGERIQWVTSVNRLRLLADSRYDLTNLLEQNVDLDSVCNIPNLLYGLTHPGEVDAGVVLLALNLLDDLVFCVEYPLPHELQAILDDIVVRISEGSTLSDAVAGVGPNDAVEAVLASLGRVLTFSDFNVDHEGRREMK